jgi:hypothetical protein
MSFAENYSAPCFDRPPLVLPILTGNECTDDETKINSLATVRGFDEFESCQRRDD